MVMVMLIAIIGMIIAFVAINIKGFLYGKKWANRLDLDLYFSKDQAEEGEKILLYETIENNKDMILPAISVKFKTSRYLKFEDGVSGSVTDYYYRNDVLSVDKYEKVRRKIKLMCSKRGHYTVSEAQLIGECFYIQRNFIEQKQTDASLIVYPSFVGVEKIHPVFEYSYGEFSSKIPMFEDPFEYVGVRDYQSGDTMRKINWKLSAKVGRWQVRTSAYTAAEPAVIILNLESPGNYTNYNALEESIRIAYSLVFYLDKKGIPTTIVTNGGDGFRIKGNGRSHLANVRRQLAMVSYDKLSKSGTSLLIREEELITANDHLFYISATGKKEEQQKLYDLLLRGNHVMWVAAIFDGEDDTANCLPAIRSNIFRWRG